MIHLVLIYCLVGQGHACVTRRPLLESLSSLSGCMVAAQPIAAAWVAEHPKYRLAKWKCEIDVPEQRRI